MGWTLTNIWNLITYDVEDVVYKTANKVLTEEGVSKEEIHSRAAALKAIGEIFSVSSNQNDCQFEEVVAPYQFDLSCLLLNQFWPSFLLLHGG